MQLAAGTDPQREVVELYCRVSEVWMKRRKGISMGLKAHPCVGGTSRDKRAGESVRFS
jgi:hypothetical protein